MSEGNIHVATKVESDAQVAMNKNSDPVENFSVGVAGEQFPQLTFFTTSGIVQNESS